MPILINRGQYKLPESVIEPILRKVLVDYGKLMVFRELLNKPTATRIWI